MGVVLLFQAGGQQRQRPGGEKEPVTFRGQQRGQRGWGAEVTDYKSEACLPVDFPFCTVGPEDLCSSARIQPHKAHSQPSPVQHPSLSLQPPLPARVTTGTPAHAVSGSSLAPVPQLHQLGRVHPTGLLLFYFFFLIKMQQSSHSQLPLQRSVKMNSRRLD